MNQKVSAHKRTPINGVLTVKKVERLSNNLIRIQFDCDKVLRVDPNWIVPHLKLMFPFSDNGIVFPKFNEEQKIIWQDGMRERVRTYSIRHYDQRDNSLTIDFVVHTKGVATSWAQQANIGDSIGLIGMGSKNQFNQDIQLVLLGDMSAMPAICYTLEHLPENQKAIGIIQVNDAQDCVKPNLSHHAQLHWVQANEDDKSALKDHIIQLNLVKDSRNIMFFGGMESSLTQSLRRFLKDHFTQLPGDAIQLISYWRKGYAEGEFKHHD